MYYDVSKIVSINKQKINRNDGDNHLMTIQPQLCQVEDLHTAGLPLDGEYSTWGESMIIPPYLIMNIYNNNNNNKSITQLKQVQQQQHRLQKEQITSNQLDSTLKVTTAVGTSMIPPCLAMNIYNNDKSITQLQ